MPTTTKKGDKKQAPERVSLKVQTYKEVDITIVGLNRLCVHKFSEKSRKQMRDKQLGKAKRKPEEKQPVELMKDTLYRFSDEVEGTIYGIPAVAIKQAAQRAFKFFDGKTMQDAKGFMHIYGEVDAEGMYELVPIIAPPVKGLNYKEKLVCRELGWDESEMLEALEEPHKYGASLREDDVRVGMGTADIRYRAAFETWKIPFTVEYNTNQVTAEEIVNAINDAGRTVGICENRPQKSGNNWGTFKVEI